MYQVSAGGTIKEAIKPPNKPPAKAKIRTVLIMTPTKHHTCDSSVACRQNAAELRHSRLTHVEPPVRIQPSMSGGRHPRGAPRHGVGSEDEDHDRRCISAGCFSSTGHHRP